GWPTRAWRNRRLTGDGKATAPAIGTCRRLTRELRRRQGGSDPGIPNGGGHGSSGRWTIVPGRLYPPPPWLPGGVSSAPLPIAVVAGARHPRPPKDWPRPPRAACALQVRRPPEHTRGPLVG